VDFFKILLGFVCVLSVWFLLLLHRNTFPPLSPVVIYHKHRPRFPQRERELKRALLFLASWQFHTEKNRPLRIAKSDRQLASVCVCVCVCSSWPKQWPLLNLSIVWFLFPDRWEGRISQQISTKEVITSAFIPCWPFMKTCDSTYLRSTNVSNK